MLCQVHAVSHYTYLNMKMSGPKGVLTVGSMIEHAFNCDIEHVEALALNESLMVDMEKLANEGLDSPSKHACSFEAAKQTKAVSLNPSAPRARR
jgi:hypothetical protein